MIVTSERGNYVNLYFVKIEDVSFTAKIKDESFTVKVEKVSFMEKVMIHHVR